MAKTKGDLEKLGGRDLLRLYAEVLEALRGRDYVRSANNPVADYAEKLVCVAFGLDPAPKSNKGYDARDPQTGERYEIKARRVTPHNKPTRFSPLRDFEAQHFDHLVAILFNSNFSVHQAVKVPWAAINDEMSFHSEYVNGRIVYVRDVLWTAAGAVDITSNLRQAESAI